MNTEKPFVSVIIPCRNEADFIERCVRSVLACDYPHEKIEVLVVDGMSNDTTRDIIASMSKTDERINLIDNPKKIVPTAMNAGIEASKGEIIIRVDGHAEVPVDFIQKSVDVLNSHPEAWCAGGPIKSINSNLVGNAIAAAMSSPFGVGNAMFRLGNYEGYVDTIAFGAYWRLVFDKIGMFDEQLIRNQDDELNYRLIAGGGKIWMTPEIHSKYYTRGSLKKLWRQYFQYGFWRIRTMQKHRRPATIRQLVPLLLVSSLLLLLAGGFLWQPFWWLLFAETCFYSLGLLIGSIDVTRKTDIVNGLLAPLIFIILHFSYGLGCLWGIARFVLLQGKGMGRAEEFKLSR